jgi:polyhydroxyalkanoate synthesis regulator protein
MFERTMQMFQPFIPKARAGEEAKGNGTAEAKPRPSEEISELKTEIEEMRRQLSELSQRK